MSPLQSSISAFCGKVESYYTNYTTEAHDPPNLEWLKEVENISLLISCLSFQDRSMLAFMCILVSISWGHTVYAVTGLHSKVLKESPPMQPCVACLSLPQCQQTQSQTQEVRLKQPTPSSMDSMNRGAS
eukprot:1041478-Amphidinium_carterae.2